MPTSTYIALANTTVSSNTTEVTMSSIPATYRDLVLIVAGNATAGGNALLLKFNGSTSNMSYVQMIGTGSAATSNAASAMNVGAVFTSQGVNIINIMDYSATDKHKTVISRGSTASDDTRAIAARWGSTNAVTSIGIYLNNNQFASGTSFALYGIIS